MDAHCNVCRTDISGVDPLYQAMGVCSDGCLGSRSRVALHERVGLSVESAEVLLSAVRRAYPRFGPTLAAAVNELANQITVTRVTQKVGGDR